MKVKVQQERKKHVEMAAAHAAALASQVASTGNVMSMDGHNDPDGGVKKT